MGGIYDDNPRRTLEKNGHNRAQDVQLKEHEEAISDIVGSLKAIKAIGAILSALWIGLVALFMWQASQIVEMHTTIERNATRFEANRDTILVIQQELRECRATINGRFNKK